MAVKKKVYGFELTNKSTNIHMCVSCTYRKQERDLVPSIATKKNMKKLELVHNNLCGPIEMLTFHMPRKYILTFINDWS